MRQYGWLAGVVITVALLSMALRPVGRSARFMDVGGAHLDLHIEGVALGMSRADVEQVAGPAVQQGRSYLLYWDFPESTSRCAKSARWPHPERMFSGKQSRPLGGVSFGRDDRVSSVFGQNLWHADNLLARPGWDATVVLAAYPPRTTRQKSNGVLVHYKSPLSIYTRDGKVLGVMLRGKQSKARR